MYIQCTKKLLDKMGRLYEELGDPPQPIYCWHASCFEQRGEQFVVLVNDQSEAVHSFKISSFQDFDKLVKETLEGAMMDDHLRAEEIAWYWQQAEPIAIGPTGNLSLVGRLSHHTRKLKEARSPGNFFLGMEVNATAPLDLDAMIDRLFDELEQKVRPSEPMPMQKSLPKRATSQPNSSLLALDAELLLGAGAKVSRSFLVPFAMDFSILSTILQMGFGWSEDSAHEFRMKKDTIRIGPDISDMQYRLMWEDKHADVYLERETALSDFIPGVRRIKYLYGFDRGWLLTIKVGKVIPYDGAPYVECTGGEGTTPPEDCGGPPGYDEICEILEDPTHDEYADTVEWMKDNRDAGFELKRINKKFKRMKFVGSTR